MEYPKNEEEIVPDGEYAVTTMDGSCYVFPFKEYQRGFAFAHLNHQYIGPIFFIAHKGQPDRPEGYSAINLNKIERIVARYNSEEVSDALALNFMRREAEAAANAQPASPEGVNDLATFIAQALLNGETISIPDEIVQRIREQLNPEDDE